MSKGQLTYKGAVYPWHCDHMGHMNVMWYVGKFDEATWGFFASIGLTPSGLREANRGLVALDQHLTYQREAVSGDVLEIFTRPLEIKNKTIRFFHEMIDCETLETAATCELVGVYLDTEARKSLPLPEDVWAKACQLLED